MCGKPHVAESFVLTMMNTLYESIADFKIQGMRTGLQDPAQDCRNPNTYLLEIKNFALKNCSQRLRAL